MQTFVELQPPAPANRAVGGLRLTRTEVAAPVAKFDLSLTLQEQPSELTGSLEYDTALFERATIERFVDHLHALAAAMCADETRAVATLPLLTEPELEEQLVRGNDTARAYDLSVPAHALFAEQAAQTPDAIAVVLGDDALTYAELATRARGLAHHLQRAGVGPEVLVGVCMDRSLELIVAVLAVLEAGGAYVPLDPEAPPERLAYMVRDAAAPVVLTQRHLRERISGAAILEVDGLDRSGEPADVASELAYVIYTSGSTGRPKGVEITHRALANHVRWMQETLALGPGDRWLQKTTLGFDASISELFAPLHAGATIVLAAPGEHRDAGYLVRAVQQHAITILQMVPSALRVLALEPELPRCTTLRHVMAGGEALDGDTIAALHRALPHASIGNYYGPTEATVDATSYLVPRDAPADAIAPIGTPAANYRAYVLDGAGQLLPRGTTGELYLGGAGIARGYHGEPALTAERFVASPFVAGDRLYRTGDRARWRRDGNLEFRGRSDHQIKLRGHRIELGEIESVLAAQPGVKHAAVLVRDDRLAAYVDGAALDAVALRAALVVRLPDYMIPATFTLLPRLPTLPNGKIDRGALPAPEGAVTPRARVEPRTATEQLVVAAFRDALGHGDLDLDDNFFELGGHSLLAGRVMARLRAQAAIDLPLRVLFERPTAGALAAAIDALASAHAPHDPADARQRLGEQLARQSTTLIPLHAGAAPTASSVPIFGVAGHNGDVFCYLPLAHELGPAQPFYGLQPPGYEPGTVALPDVDHLAELFASEIAAFIPRGRCIVTGYCAGGAIGFELARRLTAKGVTVERLVLFGAPFSTWYRPAPQAVARVRHWLERAGFHGRELAKISPRAWTQYVADSARRVLAPPPDEPLDPMLARRRLVEHATMIAVRHYTPARFAGHVDVMVPARSWQDLPASLLRWRDHAATSAVYVGPDDCTSDSMLRPPHAAVFAALLASARRRHGHDTL